MKSPHGEEVQREVKDLQEAEDTLEYTLFSLNSREGQKSFEVELKLDGTPLRMEVDTGASVSLISESKFRQLWPSRPLESSTVRLRTYTGAT